MNINDEYDEDTFPELVPPPAQEPEIVEEYVEDISDKIPDTEVIEEEDIVLHPEPKEILKKKDMFISTPSSKKNIKVIKDVDADLDDEIGDIPDIKPLKKPRKKRVMSEEHLAKLAIARKKGLETRLRNTELRRKAKESKTEEIEVVKAVRKKRIEKLKKELVSEEEEEEEDDEIIPVKKKSVKIKTQGYSQEDMTQAISVALEKQEVGRKTRKAEKKKKAEQEKVFQTISKALQPHDMWGECFA
tara:strand:+ start:826 stop:1560 length:735 start_codon:yes stop_codon:yes gene_type:complete